MSRRVAMMAALAALAPATSAEAASKNVKPVVSRISPMTVHVGQTLTIYGKNFIKGAGKNSVVFKRDGAPAVFVKADIATRRMMKVVVSDGVGRYLMGSTATVFRLRVLARRFGASFTAQSKSPRVLPALPPGTTDGNGDGGNGNGNGAPASTSFKDPVHGGCDGKGYNANADSDGDLLSDGFEYDTLKTDPCKADTDGDGIEDGYEYRSAVDLNDDEYQNPQTSLPYPGTKPYPNPLDPSDKNIDFDGDGLTLFDEYNLWVYTWRDAHTAAHTLTPLSYSDGLQYSVYSTDASGHRHPALSATNYDRWNDFLNWTVLAGYRNITLHDNGAWTNANGPVTEGVNGYSILDTNRDGTDDYTLDVDHNGWLSDDERDEDADGLSNFDELHSRMTPEYWKGCYGKEPAYPVPYAGTLPTNPDSDGDGVRDGADDQDHDDIPNIMELSRFEASGLFDGKAECTPADNLPNTLHPTRFGKVNPFNPCDPDPESRTCQRHPELGTDPGPQWWSLN
jgi:hypothetical protein